MVDPGIVTYVTSGAKDDVTQDPGTSNRNVGTTATFDDEPVSAIPPTESIDLVMENIRKLGAFLDAIEHTPQTLQERPGIPNIEKDVGRVTSGPPPTWSMMQENELLKSLHPTLTKDTRKPGRKVQVVNASLRQAKTSSPARGATFPSKPSTPEEISTQPSLFEKLKEKAVSDANPKPPESTPVASGPVIEEPFPIGRDDTMKSPSEIMDEEEMRSVWTRLRDQRQ